jgi:diaminopimelate decarboxylase
MIAKAGELEGAGFHLEFLDFGGGFGPRYAAEQTLFPLARYAAAICGRIRRSGLRPAAIAVEPGKSLVADAGAILLRVEYVKESYGNIFACVNGGTFNTLPRSAIYAHPYHEIVNAGPMAEKNRSTTTGLSSTSAKTRLSLTTESTKSSSKTGPLSDRNIVPVTVAGHICETGDVFGRDLRMPRPEPGDILVVLGAGASGRSMASNFNLRPIPAEIVV